MIDFVFNFQTFGPKIKNYIDFDHKKGNCRHFCTKSSYKCFENVVP